LEVSIVSHILKSDPRLYNESSEFGKNISVGFEALGCLLKQLIK
jgi:hypothetical protein